VPITSNFDTSRNISVIAREDGSGTKSAFMEIIGLKGQADPATVIIQTGTAGVLAEVAGNPGAIAYESLGYVTNSVKMLDVNGVTASIDNIIDGSYKIARPLSIVYLEETLDNELASAFFDFLQSYDAFEIIMEKGYVPTGFPTDGYVVNETLSGNLEISGSTSLQPLMLEFAITFEELQPNVIIDVAGGGSGTGYNNAEVGVSHFGMISEEFNAEKAPSCVYATVAMDGIAVIVHNSNPLDDISLDDLQNLYNVDAGDGAFVTWADIIR